MNAALIAGNALPTNMLGVGLYTAGEAARYTGIPARDISRWLFGYSAGKKHYDGLWRTQFADHDLRALGFHDLLEVRFVHAFRQHGVSLQAIRHASDHARVMYNQPYPFTCTRFQTDGRSIFATVLDEIGDESLLDLVKKQYTFREVIRPSLYAGIEYSDSGKAERWFPQKRNRKVVLDPGRNFGKPVLTDYDIDTSILKQAWETEGENTRFVAAIYQIPVAAVEAAIQFEQRIVA